MKFVCPAIVILVLSISLLYPAATHGQGLGPLEGLTWYMNYPSEVLAHDFDGDGDQDVLAGCADGLQGASAERRISWFENNGTGGFIAEHLISSSERYVRDMQLADLDGDGDQDVIVIISDTEFQTRWFENLGNGVFGAAQDVTPNHEGCLALGVADMDADGDLDLVSTSEWFSTRKLVWYPNNGSGVFVDSLTIDPECNSIQDITIVDLDEDGDMDILTAQSSYRMGWYENLGGGQFSAYHIIDQLWTETHSVRVGDIDLDGDLDVVASYYSQGDLKWLENDGAENFTVHVISSFFIDIREIELGDMDEDGDLDVVGAGWGYPRWCENLGDGTFAEPQWVEEANTRLVWSLDLADINGDGHVDVLWCDHGDRVSWVPNLGHADFLRSITVSPQLYSIGAFTTGDMDRDGDIEIVTSSGYHDKLSLIENLGNGQFEDPRNISSSDDLAMDVSLADMDGDGHMDVISASELNDRAAWYRNNGDGTFGPQRGIGPSSSNIRAVESLDVDGDGDLDGVSSVSNSGSVRWHRHVDQTFNFSNTILTPTIGLASSIEVGDLNGDGVDDVLVDVQSSENIVWYPNLISGDLGPAQFVTGNNTGTTVVQIGDIDADGDNDILSLSNSSNELLLFRNEGNGVFGPPEPLDVAPTLQYLAMGDMDRDGDLDIVTGAVNNGFEIRWYENIGETGPAPAQVLWSSLINGPMNFQLADLDGDGDADVVGMDKMRNRMVWMRNDMNGGCTDPSASNYDPLAILDNGTCCQTQRGCTVAGALNYSTANGCEDGSCIYPIEGTVFLDLNSNGIQDSGEDGLGGQEIRIFPSNSLVITDNDGHFSANVSGSIGYSFLLTDPSSAWSNTTPAFLTLDATVPNWNQPLQFGVLQTGQTAGLVADIVPSSSVYPCDTLTMHRIVVTNQGNQTVDIEAAFTYDDNFVGHEAVTPIVSFEQHTLHYAAPAVAPGATVTFKVLLSTPDASFDGNALTTSVAVVSILSGSEIANAAYTITQDLSCFGMGQQKQAVPAGVTEANLIAVNTTMHFVLRFHNNGAAAVTNTFLLDTIAPGFDLQTFELTGSSHPVNTNVDPQGRVVSFNLSGIQLAPDDEGYVSYSIRVALAIPSLTELRNTAWIFFDGIPQGPTNTTLNTVLDCADMVAVPSVGTLTVCQGALFGAEATGVHVTEYTWYFGGVEVGDAAIASFVVATEAGVRTLSLHYGNGFCTDSVDLSITVTAAPVAVIEGPEGFCVGDSAILSSASALPATWYLGGQFLSGSTSILVAEPGTYTLVPSDAECEAIPDTLVVTEFADPDAPVVVLQGGLLTTVVIAGTDYQWHLNGVPIPNASAATWEPMGNGEYTVVITDANGCSASSDAYALLNVGIDNVSTNDLGLFPNPTKGQLWMSIPPHGDEWRYRIIDPLGQTVLEGRLKVSDGSAHLDVSALASGKYALHASSSERSIAATFLVQH